jgi:hypothetical protein
MQCVDGSDNAYCRRASHDFFSSIGCIRVSAFEIIRSRKQCIEDKCMTAIMSSRPAILDWRRPSDGGDQL